MSATGSAPATKEVQILCLGDSLTEGYENYGTSFHPYSLRLEQLLSEANIAAKVTTSGVSGDVVGPLGWFQVRLSRLLEQQRFDFVVILGGTNDLGAGKKTEAVLRDLAALWQKAIDSGAKVVAMTLPQLDIPLPMKRVAQMNLEIREYLKGRNIPFVDLELTLPFLSLTVEEKKQYWGDSIHPTALGYDRIGELVFGKLVELGVGQQSQ